MKTLPITLNNPEILLIGGGKVAKQKADVLMKNSINFQTISRDFIADFPNCNKLKREVFSTDFQNYNIIIDATGSDEIGKKLKIAKEKNYFLLNRVDKPADSDFFFNSLILRDNLKISISTSGKSPKMGQIIRNRIEKDLPKNIGETLNNFGKDRENGNINLENIENQTKKTMKKVYLIGAGTGDPELLTIKAYKIIQSVDTIFYDHLISKEILELIPKNIKVVTVGKQKGSHSKKQSEINDMMIQEVENGKIVGRLKAGDPYIFGRGAEEFLYLAEKGVSVEVIAGVSSAISNGLPPTVRGYSSSFTVVSAHLRGNSLNLDWIPLLKMENHTVTVLMGISRAKEIVEEALRLGIQKDLPTLIVSNISRENETRIVTSLENLTENSKKAKRPAIIIFGKVVKLDKQLN